MGLKEKIVELDQRRISRHKKAYCHLSEQLATFLKSLSSLETQHVRKKEELLGAVEELSKRDRELQTKITAANRAGSTALEQVQNLSLVCAALDKETQRLPLTLADLERRVAAQEKALVAERQKTAALQNKLCKERSLLAYELGKYKQLLGAEVVRTDSGLSLTLALAGKHQTLRFRKSGNNEYVLVEGSALGSVSSFVRSCAKKLMHN